MSSWPARPVVSILVGLLVATDAHAQWSAGGAAVCTAPSTQGTMAMVSDGSGGAILAWQDSRNLAISSTDIYAQHIQQDGALDPAWPAQGLALCTAVNNQWNPSIAWDGQGGAIVVWADFRFTSDPSYGPMLYAQHVTGSGAIASGWPAEGLPVSSLPAFSWRSFDVAEDGQGGVFVSWLGAPNAMSLVGVDVQRIASSGGPAPGWPGDGVVIVRQRNTDWPKVAGDGAGGCFVTWADDVAQSDDPVPGVYLQRLGPAGAPASGWAAGGKVVIANNSGRTYPSSTNGLMADGLSGAFIACSGYGSEYNFLLDQSVDDTGTPRWGATGIELRWWPIIDDVHLERDDSGGIFVAWEEGVYNDTYASTWDLSIVRQDPAGALAPGWSGSIFACDTAGAQRGPRMIADGVGGVLLTWRGVQPPASQQVLAYAQHLDGSGNPVAGWSPSGLRVCASDSAQAGVALVPDGSGGAVVAFTDYRNKTVTGVDIYAQRRLGDGTVPVAAVDPGSAGRAGLVVSPNPAAGALRVRFETPRAASAELELVDVGGRRVAARSLGSLTAGAHEIRWDAAGWLRSGIYWLRLRSDGSSWSRRIAILR